MTQHSLPNTENGEVLTGTVERLAFHNTETGWTVIRVSLENDEIVTVVGPIGVISEGESVEAQGRWEINPRFGRQFRADYAHVISPSSLAGIRKYLSSAAIPGVGPALASRIVDRFGTETMQILTQTPERLEEIHGIGQRKSRRIATSWATVHAERQLLIQLYGVGLGPGAARRLIAAYGRKAMTALRTNPYALAEQVEGIGFKTADKIAAGMGISPDDDHRVDAGLVFTMKKAIERGHSFLPKEELLSRAAELLAVGESLVRSSVDRLLSEKRLVEEIEGIYLPSFLATERYVARRLAFLSACSVPKEPVTAYEEALLAELDEDQRQAVRMAFNSGCLIVTGGPGTGKTTLVRHVCRLARLKRCRILLCAPTGRAARRLEEATNYKASTIHRLLEFNPMTMTFERNESSPLVADMVVVDETSMVDLPLMGSLLAAIPNGCRLLFVGDADQLPPVGPGAVLREALASNSMPSVRLTKVYRQALESLIVVNAHRVNRGLQPITEQDGSKEDYYFIKRNDPDEIVEVVLELVGRRIPDRLHVDPFRDIQVVSPMRRGSLGTEMLNRKLQALLNPHGDEVTRGAETLRVRDRVMQIKNNYKKLTFNGEQGTIQSIDGKDRTIRVSFDGRNVEYDFGELDELSLAYASTVHKAQGSEYPAVVVILHTQHYIMLRRNLLYTALTRGRQLVTVVGSPKAVAIAVQNDQVDKRYSNLSQRLLGANSSL